MPVHRHAGVPLDNDEVTGERSVVGASRPAREERCARELPEHVDPRAIRPPVADGDDASGERVVDGFVPAKKCRRRHDGEKVAQQAAPMKPRPGIVEAHEVDRVALGEVVGAMTRHALRGRVQRAPFASQWKVDDDDRRQVDDRHVF
jgi:hypothetical protein